MRVLTMVFTVICGFTMLAQETVILAKRDGVEVNYQLLLKKKERKKDKYILIVNSVNNSASDLYYEVPLVKGIDGKGSLPYIPEQLGFTKVKVRNSARLFGDGQSISGERTKFVTTNNSILYRLKRGDIFTKETTFKVKRGELPMITNTFYKSLKPLESFDLKISKEMLEGDFISSCGNVRMNINVANSLERGDYLIQTTNGRQFIWLRNTKTTFVREGNKDYLLTFNKATNSFTYSTIDGIVCKWIK